MDKLSASMQRAVFKAKTEVELRELTLLAEYRLARGQLEREDLNTLQTFARAQMDQIRDDRLSRRF